MYKYSELRSKTRRCLQHTTGFYRNNMIGAVMDNQILTPKEQALALLHQAIETGIRGNNKAAIQTAIDTLNHDGDLCDLNYRKLVPGKILRDPNRPGFIMRANKSNKLFIYRYNLAGNQSELKLGAYTDMSLMEARTIWETARKEVLSGRKPTLDTSSTLTVKLMCERYIALSRTRKRSWKEDERQINLDIIPNLGSKQADKITPEDIEHLLLAVLNRKSPRSAEKLLALLRFMFNVALGIGKGRTWHLVSDKNAASIKVKPWITLPANPCASITLPDHKPQSVYLNEKQLRSFVRLLPISAMPEDVQQLLMLQLMTCARVGEVAAMTFDELNLHDAIWTLPVERSKNGQEHRVMLPAQAVEILKQREDVLKNGYVFTSGSKSIRTDSIGSWIAKNREQLKAPDGFTSHSLRHTCITGLASMGCKVDIRDRISNHKRNSLSDMDARYNRYEYDQDAREWLQRWANHLSGLVDNVCNLEQARQTREQS